MNDKTERKRLAHHLAVRNFRKRLRNGHNRITVYEFPDLDTARGEFQRRIARIKFE